MATVTVFANQKGGVGKTTTSIHIAAAVAMKGHKTLLIDMDPQGNLASGLGIRKSDLPLTTYDLLCDDSGELNAKELCLETPVKNLFLIPSNLNLAGAEIELTQKCMRNTRLREALQPLLEEFEYIFIDSPPSLSIFSVNALAAADAVVVPMPCDYYALEGLGQLQVTLKRVRECYNPRLDFAAILLTMVDGRLTLTKEVQAELGKYYSEKLLKTVISRSVRLAEAPSYGLPVFLTHPASKSAKEYAAAAKEIMMRI